MSWDVVVRDANDTVVDRERFLTKRGATKRALILTTYAVQYAAIARAAVAPEHRDVLADQLYYVEVEKVRRR